MNSSQKDNQSILIIAPAEEAYNLSNILSQQGYHIYCTSNSSTILKEVERIFPNLILLDYQFFSLDNCICQQIKSNWRTKDIPIIFLSSRGCNLDRAFIAGSIDYITKPFQHLEVLIKVKNQLDFQLALAEIYRLNNILEVKVQQRTKKLEAQIQKLQLKILECQQIEQKLAYDALHDSLTGLPNRSFLLEKIATAKERVKRNPNYLFALLFIDLDNFKLVNDNFGHCIGDKLLIAVAKLFLQELRELDTVARLGGDEFVILLDGVREPKYAVQVCDRLLSRFCLPIEIERCIMRVGLSIGIAYGDRDSQEICQMLKNADLAMYQAKAKGRGCYEVFEPQAQLQTLNINSE